ncbi:hypothetical protein MUK42_17637 [Musa troglodytarum]|uniref:Uncharacterized protein n=1 Tax=Musa troglodytarum TaxID=320322 RepID=A0A9E7HRL1_9LILI|nr:hypothetical protein MUK42_17637 [Musa troglodytarum]URE34339.1 hypothetical protein MUK42_17637 [Musa troglodytarum]
MREGFGFRIRVPFARILAIPPRGGGITEIGSTRGVFSRRDSLKVATFCILASRFVSKLKEEEELVVARICCYSAGKKKLAPYFDLTGRNLDREK